jgi:cell division protein FtsN
MPQGEVEIYKIQLGAYAARDNAEALVSRLQALNYTSHVDQGKAQDGSAVYYVHSGVYKDYTTALEAASQFVSQNIPGAIVVKVSREDKSTS